MHVQICCRILGQMPIPGRLTQSLFQVAEDLYVLESEIELHIPLSAGQGRFVVLWSYNVVPYLRPGDQSFIHLEQK